MTDIPKIALTQGQFALVDAEDFEYLNQWKWYAGRGGMGNSFYALRREGKRPNRLLLRMHRVIMNTPDGMDCDHINHDTLDNRKQNLRNCTHADNSRNVHRSKSPTSGFRGVQWSPSSNKWVARIRFNGHGIYLGCFEDKLDAARAYDIAAIAYFGQFAVLNLETYD